VFHACEIDMLAGLVRWLFDPSGLTPHGFCRLWEPGLLWLHAVSDFGIGSAYFASSLALFSIIRRRSDVKFRPVVGLFASFILLCGIGHWLDLLTLWVPAYGVEGLVKAVTAASSIVTAVAVWKLMPQILALPSPAQFRNVETDLQDVRLAERQVAAVANEASRDRDEMVLELSRREAAEKESHESEERFRLLLQSAVTEALYLLAPDGTVETWNAGAEKIKGYAPEEIIGQNFSLFFTPEDRANGEPARILATVRDHGRFSGEVVRVRKGGDRLLAHVSIDAVRRDDGALRGFVKVTRDITSTRVEAAQRAIIIEAAPNGIMIVDESGVITLANSQTEPMFGCPDGELVGQPVELLVPDSFRAAHGAMRSRFTSGHDVRGMAMGREFTGRRRDGSAVSVEILLSPVKTPTGRVVLVSLFDVTEKAAASGIEPRTAAVTDPASGCAEFDRTMLQGIADALPAIKLAEHMRTLIARCEALLDALRNPGTPARDFVDDVHRLAGGAGMFGLLSVAAAARDFEFVAKSDAADTTAVAGRLAAAIEASLPIIRQELHVTAMAGT
jgi:PAS domain S-box-containing protein